MATQRAVRVRDPDMDEIEKKLVAALRGRREATIADLVADTALPKIRVEEGMRSVLHEYVGHLKATESGELLYSFPSGMRNQVRGFGARLKRGLRSFGRGALKVLAFLFKVWIALMLVGYFALFVALIVLAVVASIAASMAARGQGDRDNRSRGGGFGGFYLVSRIIDLLFFRMLLGRGPQRQRRERGRPLHRSVFAYVFGEKDPEPAWVEMERQVLLRHIRANKGVITLEETIRITGRSREDAERLVTELLVEYEGEPQVTERGSIVYFFPELLRTRQESLRAEGRAALPRKPLIPFSENKPKANGWISFFNVFNLVFGSYFLGFSAAYLAGTFSPEGLGWFYWFVGRLIQQFLGASPVPVMAIGLGLVPAVFSVVFFVVPLVRKVLLERRNEKIREQNVRRDVYGHILASPEATAVEELAREAREQALTPGGPRKLRPLPNNVEGFVTREVDQLAAVKDADIETLPDGRTGYRFRELAEELKDVQSHRARIDLSQFDVGKTVFDSSE